MNEHIETERQAAAALGPLRDAADRVAREWRADVERVAEAITIERSLDILCDDKRNTTQRIRDHFEVAEAFIEERNRRRAAGKR